MPSDEKLTIDKLKDAFNKVIDTQNKRLKKLESIQQEFIELDKKDNERISELRDDFHCHASLIIELKASDLDTAECITQLVSDNIELKEALRGFFEAFDRKHGSHFSNKLDGKASEGDSKVCYQKEQIQCDEEGSLDCLPTKHTCIHGKKEKEPTDDPYPNAYSLEQKTLLSKLNKKTIEVEKADLEWLYRHATNDEDTETLDEYTAKMIEIEKYRKEGED